MSKRPPTYSKSLKTLFPIPKPSHTSTSTNQRQHLIGNIGNHEDSSQHLEHLIGEIGFGQQVLEIPSFSDFRKLHEPPSEISIHDIKSPEENGEANENGAGDQISSAAGDKKKSAKRHQLEGTLQSITEGIDTMPESGFIHHYWIDKSWYKTWRSSFLVSNDPKIHRTAYHSSVSLFHERARHLATFPNIIHPYSIFRWYWDLIFIVVIICTLLLIPVHMTFYFDDPDFIQWSQWITVFFIVDILLNFTTGIVNRRDASVCLDPLIIAKYYLCSWLLMDILSTVPFYLIYVEWTHGGKPDSEQLVKIGQENLNFKTVVQLLELCKLFRLPRLIQYFTRIQKGEGMLGIQIRLINFIIISVILTHWFTCFHYLIPYLIRERLSPKENNAKKSWITQRELWNAPISTIYLTSLLRTISGLFCVAVGHEDITEPEEMILMIINIVIGVICFTFLSGFIATIIFSSCVAERKYVEVCTELKSYLKFKQIPPELQSRILLYYDCRYQRNFFNEEQILNSLSDVLRRDVLMYSCRQLVENVPLFSELPAPVLYAIVSKLQFELYLPLDLIIKKGTIGDSMYFIEHGLVTILQENGSVLGQLKDGDFFGELSLLSPNDVRTSSIVATSKCDVYRLSTSDFTQVIEAYPEILQRIMKISNTTAPNMEKIIETVERNIDKDDKVQDDDNEKNVGNKRSTNISMPASTTDSDDVSSISSYSTTASYLSETEIPVQKRSV